jgi:hypothetical protein
LHFSDALAGKDVAEMTFDLKVIADWADHKQFSPVRAYQDFGLVEPSVRCEISGPR